MSLLPADVRTSDLPLDLTAAARDLWPGGTLDFWQGRPAPEPARVFWPKSEAEVHAVLKAASESQIPVTTYGMGSGVCGGARGREGAWVLDTKAMDAIGPLDSDRRTVEAQAGVNGQHLEDWLNARGFTLGHSPSSIWCSTVGGWAAARSAGQFSSRYGVFEDMVLGLGAVSPSRGAFSVGEGGDSPDDWMELLLGSEGTLAVITKVKMRVWPLPRERVLRGYRFPDVASAIRAMRGLMQGELWPAVVRLYDPVDTRIGGRTKTKENPEEEHRAFYREWLAAVDGMPSIRRRLLALPLALPGLVNNLFGSMASGCLLVVGWEGEPEVVKELYDVGHALLCKEGEDLGTGPGERWFHSRHAVSFKLMPIFERGGFADTMEVACRWSDVEALYDAVRAALGKTAVVMAHMSHVYPEGASIYFSFAGRGDPAVYDRTWKAALEACLSVGATVTHHHGVGSLKAAAASEEVGPAVAGWRSLKKELDPASVMNAGRLFVDVPHREIAPPELRPDDGMARAPLESTLSERAGWVQEGHEPMWPWESWPAPPRWLRLPWQTGWIEVAGRAGGLGCVLGRGPRSAAGPDLRGWLARRAGNQGTASFAVVPTEGAWMGAIKVADPWKVGWELIRKDLRPSSLYVKEGELRVGFRGPAARALAKIASAMVGGLVEIPWAPAPLASGPLEACDWKDKDIVALTLSGPVRRKEPEPARRKRTKESV